MNDLAINDKTMTLKEITDLLDVRHNNAMRTVAEMAEDKAFGMITQIEYSYPMPNGGTRTMETYRLDKRQSIAVAASLNVALLMRIVDRWQELESRQETIGNDQYAARLISLGLLPGIIEWWADLVGRGYLYDESPEYRMADNKPTLPDLRFAFHTWYSRNLSAGGFAWTDSQFRGCLMVLTGMFSVPAICDALKRGDKVSLLVKMPSIKGKVCNLPSASRVMLTI